MKKVEFIQDSRKKKPKKRPKKKRDRKTEKRTKCKEIKFKITKESTKDRKVQSWVIFLLYNRY